MTAISTGQRNTLCETHNMTSIPMNQGYSSSFMRAQNADLQESWHHSLTENTKFLFRQHFPWEPTF